MSWYRLPLLTLVLMGLSSPGASAEGLNDWLAAADAHHPALRGAARQVQAAEARVAGAGALPDPSLEAGLTNEGFGRLSLGSAMMSQLMVEASQMIPFPAKLYLQQTEARFNVEQAQVQARLQRLDIHSQVRQAWYGWAAVAEEQRLQQASLQWLALIDATARSYYRLGKGEQLSLIRLQTDRANLADELLRLEQEVHHFTVRLQELSGWSLPLPAQAPGLPPLPAPPALDQLEVALHQTAPQLAQLRVRIQERVIGEQQAVAELYPDFMVAGGVSHRGPLEGMWQLRVGATLPLYAAQKQIPQQQAAAHDVAAAQAELEAQTQALRGTLHRDYQQWVTVRQRGQHLQQTVMPLQSLERDSALAAFTTGKLSLEGVLERHRQLLETQIRAVSLTLSGWEAHNRILLLTGGSVV